MTDNSDAYNGGIFHCEACGRELTRGEYVAVGPTTPASKHLGIADVERDHLVVCDECFKRASSEIDTDNDQ